MIDAEIGRHPGKTCAEKLVSGRDEREEDPLPREWRWPAGTGPFDDPKVKEIAEAEGYSWGHPIENQIQGQIDAGFVITGFYEDRGCYALDNYINTSMATKAVKMQL